MDSQLKRTIIGFTAIALTLGVIIGLQAKRIDFLERALAPEIRSYHARVTSKVEGSTIYPEQRGLLGEDAVTTWKKAVNEDLELVGEVRGAPLIEAWKSGFWVTRDLPESAHEPSFQGLSPNRERMLVQLLQRLDGPHLQNCKVSYGSDNEVRVEGTTPRSITMDITYVVRPDVSHKGVWKVFRARPEASKVAPAISRASYQVGADGTSMKPSMR